MNKRYNNLLLGILLVFCGFLAGVDAFTYSNPIVKMGNMYYNKKDYPRALYLYLHAIKTVNDKKAANFNIANAYYKTNDFENALEYFENSFKNDDDVFNAKVMFNMGNCYFKINEFAKAYEKYKSSLKLVPEDKSAKYNLEYVLMVMEENNNLKRKNFGNGQRNRQSNSGRLREENDAANTLKDNMQSSGIVKDDLFVKNDFNDDFNIQSELDDISKDDARSILNTITQQVIMRRPMKKEPLTKKGEFDEKDW